MGVGKVLGSMSPLYGAITGKGLLGSGMAAFEDATGMGGLMPKMAQAARNKRRARAGEEEKDNANMKRGGKVKKMAHGGSASKRADGCAIKGKTKGKMV